MGFERIPETFKFVCDNCGFTVTRPHCSLPVQWAKLAITTDEDGDFGMQVAYYEKFFCFPCWAELKIKAAELCEVVK